MRAPRDADEAGAAREARAAAAAHLDHYMTRKEAA